MKTANELKAIATAKVEADRKEKIERTQKMVENQLMPNLEGMAGAGHLGMDYRFDACIDLDIVGRILKDLGYDFEKINPVTARISWG